MVLNELLLKDMLGKTITEDKKRFVFLSDDRMIAENIIHCGYNAIPMVTVAEMNLFLAFLEQNQFIYACDYYFIFTSLDGYLKQVSEYIENNNFIGFYDATKLFLNQKSIYKISEFALKNDLDKYTSGISQLSEKALKEKLEMKAFSEIPEKEVEWLIPQYIPSRQVTILAGDGGVGKTSTWCNIAAAISAGRSSFLLQDKVETALMPQKVMVFSGEDSAESVLVGRLSANGAKLENIKTIEVQDERLNDVTFDGKYLEMLIEKHKPALVIMDPLQAFLPDRIRMADRSSIRKCMRPLISHGETYGCTFLIVAHSNKQSGVSGRKRLADSADIFDLARSVLMVGRTQEEGILYISQEKSNYGPEADTVLFTLNKGKVMFHSYTKLKDRHYMMAESRVVGISDEKSRAMEFVQSFLQDGEKEVKELEVRAKEQGISANALKNAKKELKESGIIDVRNSGFGNTKKHYVFLKNL